MTDAQEVIDGRFVLTGQKDEDALLGGVAASGAEASFPSVARH